MKRVQSCLCSNAAKGLESEHNGRRAKLFGHRQIATLGLYRCVCLWDFKQVDDLNQLEDPGFLRFEFIFAVLFF